MLEPRLTQLPSALNWGLRMDSCQYSPTGCLSENPVAKREAPPSLLTLEFATICTMDGSLSEILALAIVPLCVAVI